MWATIMRLLGPGGGILTSIFKLGKVIKLVGKIRSLKKEGMEAWKEVDDFVDKLRALREELKAALEDKSMSQAEATALVQMVYNQLQEYEQAEKEVKDVIQIIKGW